MILLLLLLLALVYATNASPKSSTYRSIQSLDNSGQVSQLKYAQSAADQQGRLVIVAEVKEDDDTAICVISPIEEKRKCQREIEISTNNLVDLISPVTATQQPFLAVVCSGIRADAQWLIAVLRQYAKSVKVRYDTVGQVVSLVAAVVAVKRAVVWGERSVEGSHLNRRQELTKQIDGWGRPLGLRSIVIGCNELGKGKTPGWGIHVVEPSGISWTANECVCIGKGSSEVQSKLAKILNKETNLVSKEDLRRLLFDDVFLGSEGRGFQMETISKTGAISKTRWEAKPNA